MPPFIEVILNASGGSFVEKETEGMLRRVFSECGLDPTIRVAASGEEVETLARDAATNDADIIVAGGGDGTVSIVAAQAHRARKILGVVPLGTLNNFSKDLNIPHDPTEAVRLIADGYTADIDLAEANGRIFINNSSLGLYPRLVRDRERRQRLGSGKWRAAFWAALHVFRRSPFLSVQIEVDGMSVLQKTPFVFVGNNAYEMDLYNVGRRSVLNAGKLSVYLLHRGGRLGVIILLLRTITGTLRQWHDFEAVVTDAITIQTRHKLVQVAFDGEVQAMETPLRYKILPRALRVIVPAPEARASA